MTRGRPTRDTVYDRFAAARDELARFGGLPRPDEAAGIWDDIWHLEAHNSTAIEGNTLVLREVEARARPATRSGRQRPEGLPGGAGVRRRRALGLRTSRGRERLRKPRV